MFQKRSRSQVDGMEEMDVEVVFQDVESIDL